MEPGEQITGHLLLKIGKSSVAIGQRRAAQRIANLLDLSRVTQLDSSRGDELLRATQHPP